MIGKDGRRHQTRAAQPPSPDAGSVKQLVLEEFAAQRVAVDAQPLGGTALVLIGVLHDDIEQRTLDHLEDHVVHRCRLDAVQVGEVVLQAVADAVFYLRKW